MLKLPQVVFSWSGGKDSALAMYALQRAGEVEIMALLTTVSRTYDRISHHGVRRELLESQARALGYPLDIVYLSECCTNDEYEAKMRERMMHYRSRGVARVAFGDIFLEDLRAYREGRLQQVHMEAIFPIWGCDTATLLEQFVNDGFRGYVCCIDGTKLDASFAGRAIDASLATALPKDVDPCGENGEYHSFVWDGPIFEQPVPVRVGEIVRRDSRYFADLVSSADRWASSVEVLA